MRKVIELAKHYEKLLTAEQFIVTGSTALKLHGLDVHSGDLDIILVNPSAECQESLRKLNTLKGDYAGGGVDEKHFVEFFAKSVRFGFGETV